MQNSSIFIKPFDYIRIKNNFINELKIAYEYQKSSFSNSSLSYIEHYFHPESLINEGLIQGIVIAGNHFIVATEYLDQKGNRKLVAWQRDKLPTLNDKQTLLEFLKKHLSHDAIGIGVSIGFPTVSRNGSYGEPDCVIKYGTKEHALKGITLGDNRNVELGDFIKNQVLHNKNIKVAVANDIICLARLCKDDELGACIVSTGINMGIKRSKNHFVNLESGNFNNFESDILLYEIDKHSQNKDVNLFEKVIGGKYLTQQYNLIAHNTKLEKPGSRPIKTHDLFALAGESSPDGDKQKLASELLERSAALVAVQIAGLYEFLDRKNKKLKLVGEGSLLWTNPSYIENIQSNLESFGIPAGSVSIRKITYANIDDPKIEDKNIDTSSIEGAISLLIT